MVALLSLNPLRAHRYYFRSIYRSHSAVSFSAYHYKYYRATSVPYTSVVHHLYLHVELVIATS